MHTVIAIFIVIFDENSIVMSFPIFVIYIMLQLEIAVSVQIAEQFILQKSVTIDCVLPSSGDVQHHIPPMAINFITGNLLSRSSNYPFLFPLFTNHEQGRKTVYSNFT